MKTYFLNLIYLFRMLKDKTKQSFLNWYIGKHKKVERIFQKNDSVLNHFYKLSYQMTPIIDNIYLGNACDASYFYKLKENNITSIINVTDEIPNYFKGDFTYLKISINDINSEHFTPKQFEAVLEFIKQQQENFPDKNILIHCYMGSSRSATIVILYLMTKHNMTLEKAIHFIKQKRDIININTTFLTDLRNYQKQLKKKM